MRMLRHDRCVNVDYCNLDHRLCARCGVTITRPGYEMGNAVTPEVFCRECGDAIVARPEWLATWDALLALRA